MIDEKAWEAVRDWVAPAKWDQVRDYIDRYEELSKQVMEGVRSDAESSPQRVADNSDNVAPSAQQPVGCRSAFEKWFAGGFPGETEIIEDEVTHGMWQAWQAAWKPERESQQPVDIAMLRRKVRRGLFGKNGILKDQFTGVSDAVEFVIDLIPLCSHATERESGWQPIETCPSSPLGIEVLLCIFPVYRCFVGLKCKDGSFSSTVGMEKGYPIKITPTHWMPLPQPPENARRG